MTASRWGTILPAKSTKELVDELRKSLSMRISETGASEALQLLYGIKTELDAELALGRVITEEINKLTKVLPEINTADEIKPVAAKYAQLITGFFTARSSVSTVCTLSRSFCEKLVETAFNHAVMLLASEGRKNPATPWTVQVSGELGREESVFGKKSGIFFIYRETADVSSDYFKELALRFMAILVICLPNLSRNMNSPAIFWFSSESDWKATVVAAFSGEKTGSRLKSSEIAFPWIVETISDLRPVCGDRDFGQSVNAFGRKQLADSLRSEYFWHYAKEIAVMPVALGIFGRIKTLHSGINRGKFELEEFALTPLTAATRILATACGAVEATFAGRMQAILAAGRIGVALADRLLIAHEDLMREMIRLELETQQETTQFFFNPDSLSEESKERFKAGLEDITTLQRLVYQQLVEVEKA